jgi:hypothetical protein
VGELKAVVAVLKVLGLRFQLVGPHLDWMQVAKGWCPQPLFAQALVTPPVSMQGYGGPHRLLSKVRQAAVLLVLARVLAQMKRALASPEPLRLEAPRNAPESSGPFDPHR